MQRDRASDKRRPGVSQSLRTSSKNRFAQPQETKSRVQPGAVPFLGQETIGRTDRLLEMVHRGQLRLKWHCKCLIRRTNRETKCAIVTTADGSVHVKAVGDGGKSKSSYTQARRIVPLFEHEGSALRHGCILFGPLFFE
jgi:hypothetical protein